jgi:GDP/UDP-N,N'-diacetylbacillosamine 2-epimerase (hydrolysing)
MRKICYVSGTRADFGLMHATLKSIHEHPDLDLSIVVTGMHLLAQYGRTVGEIEQAGLPIGARIEVDMSPPTGATMARNIGHMLAGFTDAFERIGPDIVLLLGDRGEMLAGAVAAIHLNIPVVHIHGGERSGTVDEPVRHAISKLSHFHFAATQDAAGRLVRMGERQEQVYVTGAPGLDGLTEIVTAGRDELLLDAGLRADLPVALMVYHPVLQETGSAGREAETIIGALVAKGVQVVAVMPNSDAGSDAVRAVLAAYEGDGGIHVATHIPRERFVAWMAAADLQIGNSSAGIIEAASFGTPVINIGSRQGMRERNANVVDVPADSGALELAIGVALKKGRFPIHNVFGDGKTAQRISSLLAGLVLDNALLAKSNAY